LRVIAAVIVVDNVVLFSVLVHAHPQNDKDAKEETKLYKRRKMMG